VQVRKRDKYWYNQGAIVAKDSASPSVNKFIEDGMKLARTLCHGADDGAVTEKDNFIAFLRHLAFPPASYLEDPAELVKAVHDFLEEAKKSARLKVPSGNTESRKAATKGLRQRRPLLEVFCFSLIHNRKKMRKAVDSLSTLAAIEKVAYEALDELCAKEKLPIRVGRDVDLRVIYPLTDGQRTLDVGSEFERAGGSGDDPRIHKVVIEEMSAGKAFRTFREQNDLVRSIGQSGESAMDKARKDNCPDVFSIRSS